MKNKKQGKFSKLFCKRNSKRLPVNKVVNFSKRKMGKPITVLNIVGNTKVNNKKEFTLFTPPPFGGG